MVFTKSFSEEAFTSTSSIFIAFSSNSTLITISFPEVIIISFIGIVLYEEKEYKKDCRPTGTLINL